MQGPCDHIGLDDIPFVPSFSRPLIKKVARPTEREYGPIAVMGVASKLYMSHVRKEIESHLRRNGLGRDNQIGFTEGGRIEYAHFILQYMVEDSLKVKKGERGLIVMA